MSCWGCRWVGGWVGGWVGMYLEEGLGDKGRRLISGQALVRVVDSMGGVGAWVGGWVGGIHMTVSLPIGPLPTHPPTHPPTHQPVAYSNAFEPPPLPLPLLTHPPTHPPTYLTIFPSSSL